MNNSAVKKFAIRAIKLLITDIEKTVNKFGIRKHEIKQPEVNDFNKEDKLTQRSELVSLIRKKGYQSVLEEVAYNWFIRLVALRFMEVNQYIPDGISVMLSENIDREASKVILEDEHVDQYSDSREQMYKRFLIKQCNLLHELLPDVFEEMTDCMKLLAPNELIGEGSIIHLLTTLIKEEDWILSLIHI